MEVLNPATGETIAEVRRCTAADVDPPSRPPKAPARVARGDARASAASSAELADVLDENAEELAKLESLNVGKPLDASRDEMPFVPDNLRFFAGAARTLEGGPPASTSRATRRWSAASRSGSSAGSRRGTTR